MDFQKTKKIIFSSDPELTRKIFDYCHANKTTIKEFLTKASIDLLQKNKKKPDKELNLIEEFNDFTTEKKLLDMRSRMTRTRIFRFSNCYKEIANMVRGRVTKKDILKRMREMRREMVRLKVGTHYRKELRLLYEKVQSEKDLVIITYLKKHGLENDFEPPDRMNRGE